MCLLRFLFFATLLTYFIYKIFGELSSTYLIWVVIVSLFLSLSKKKNPKAPSKGKLQKKKILDNKEVDDAEEEAKALYEFLKKDIKSLKEIPEFKKALELPKDNKELDSKKRRAQAEEALKKEQEAQIKLQNHNEDHLPGYQHPKVQENAYAHKFRDKQRLKEAFIASEIFKQKFF